MRRVVFAAAAGFLLLPLMLVTFAAPVQAAEMTAPCSLEVRSHNADGSVLDEGTAPGSGGTQSDPFQVAWDGKVDFRFSTDGTVFANNHWTIYVQGVPALNGSDDNPLDTDESGSVTVSDYVPVRVVGLLNVTGDLSGNGGTAHCTGNGWVYVVGDPVGTIPWAVAATLIVLGLLFLIATPYTGDWEEAGYSPMPGGPVAG